MENILDARFERTGKSKTLNTQGMRPMQARVFAQRKSQYLLVKAPPASGKSRALMFVGLDKITHQGVRKIIVAVPEKTIGASFQSTDLMTHGFFANWAVEPEWNLCTDEPETPPVLKSKVKAVGAFLHNTDQILVCTHASLRFAFDQLGAAAFDDCLLAIDEFHHSSAHEDNRLGEVVRALMTRPSIHIMAMTGSYFRGDAVLVLRPEDEAKFTPVSYTYYEQLNGYEHLKSLGIGYHFYEGRYTDAIGAVLDTGKKTIIHIPYVNSAASEGDKINEVYRIFDVIGTHTGIDEETGFHRLKTKDGHILRVADLVDDDPAKRIKVTAALRTISEKNDVDIIIALGMAKEGFDWVWCEHALTVGYRSSLTEIVQIIGRATRDATDKPHAQFTNLIPEPDAVQDNVVNAVNELLKAISASLLMEQVLAPNFNFFNCKADDSDIDIKRDDDTGDITITVPGMKTAPTERVRSIIQNDMAELIHDICADNTIALHAAANSEVTPEEVNRRLVPRVITAKYPDLSPDEIEAIRQQAVLKMNVLEGAKAMDGAGTHKTGDGSGSLFDLVRRFISLNDLSIDLIDSINPFQSKYEVLAKDLDAPTLAKIHSAITVRKVPVSEADARENWDKIENFTKEHGGQRPSALSQDPIEKRYGEIWNWIEEQKRRQVEVNNAKDAE